ncbi:MAG: hypothetical protein QGI43_09380 [Gemmatimonadota bacterium]|jgi:hypothetical protein|nr:hypothetical protein [Gemmatimonadota bacterium]
MSRAGVVGLVLLVVVALLLSCFRITNLDLGGHLAVGERILATHAIPDTDFLSHTFPGHPYPVHQWLGEVALHLVDRSAGVGGLILLRMLIVLLAALILRRTALREGAPQAVAAALVILLLVAMQPRFFVRPFLATLVFLALLQSWVRDYCAGRRESLWPLPVLLAVWGHIHSGVLFGVLFLGGTIAGELLDRRIRSGTRTRQDDARFRPLLLYSAIAAALPFATMALINPSGLKPLVLPFLFFTNSGFTSMIGEYRPVNLATDWPFDLVAGLLLVGLALRRRRVDFAGLIVLAGFGFLAFRAVRGILPFAVVAAPVLAQTWGGLAADLSRRARRIAGVPSTEWAALLVALAAASWAGSRTLDGTPFPFGFGKDAKHYPTAALDFIETHHLQGPVFNTDLWASALLWRFGPERMPVFVDARLEAYPESFWKEGYYRVLQAVPGWREVLDRYEVQFAMIRRKGGETDDRIGDVLREDPAWGLAYWDDHAEVFLRRDTPHAAHRELLASGELVAVDPRRPGSVMSLRGADARAARDEMARLSAINAGAFLSRWAGAAAALRGGDADGAVRTLEDLSSMREARDNAAFLRTRAEAELVAGRRDAWSALLREAGGDPADPAELFDAGSLLSGAGVVAEAIALYRATLAVNPSHTDAMNNLALLLAQRPEGVPESLDLLTEAVRRMPEDPYYLASRGEVRLAAGDHDGAREDLRRALRLLPATDAGARAQVEGLLESAEGK